MPSGASGKVIPYSAIFQHPYGENYLRHTGTIFYKSIMPLAYAHDVDIIGRSNCEVAAAFSKFAEEARSIGLAVNKNKVKYLVSTAKDTSIWVSVEIMKDFVYLGSSINTDNDISLEIRLLLLIDVTLD